MYLAALFTIASIVGQVFGRDDSYPACDTAEHAHQYTRNGRGFTLQKSDDKVFWLAPGQGSCGAVYRDATDAACVAPGWVKSANIDTCQNWVEIVNPDNGISATARILDTCGAVAGSSEYKRPVCFSEVVWADSLLALAQTPAFGCNDIYVSKHIFVRLAGSNASQALDEGHLASVKWQFIKEPCYGCWAGLPGKTLTGADDDCKGFDAFGDLRCGRKAGDQRVTGDSVKDKCFKSNDKCD